MTLSTMLKLLLSFILGRPREKIIRIDSPRVSHDGNEEDPQMILSSLQNSMWGGK